MVVKITQYKQNSVVEIPFKLAKLSNFDKCTRNVHKICYFHLKDLDFVKSSGYNVKIEKSYMKYF